MKKLLSAILIAVCCYGCTKDGDSTGSIYGVVTVKSTAEPMRATGVELYTETEELLLKTVTYDDGHYEFTELNAGHYQLKVVAEGYADAEYNVVVEAGRQARADMQLELSETFMVVRTLDAYVHGDDVVFYGYASWDVSNHKPHELGFIYSSNPNPINSGTKVKANESFNAPINDLAKGNYYVVAYAINNIGTTYGEVRSFEITGAPAVSTLATTNITKSSVTLNGRVDYQGNPVFTERGFVYSYASNNPLPHDNLSTTIKKVVPGTNAVYSLDLNLEPGRVCFARAYIMNEAWISWGEAFSVTGYVLLESNGIMVQTSDIKTERLNSYDLAHLCASSNLAGYTDWRLPTMNELYAIYNQRNTIGGFRTDLYDSTYCAYRYRADVADYSGVEFSSGGYHTIVEGGNFYYARCVRTID